MKIVYIGAGSRDFGRGQVVDVMSEPLLNGRKVTIELVDINEKNLATMVRTQHSIPSC